MGLSTYAQSLVSCDRMMKFFAAQELEDYILDLDEGQKKANIAVSIKDASMHWIEETDEIRKNFLALEVKSGNEKLIRDGSYIIGDHVIGEGESKSLRTTEIGRLGLGWGYWGGDKIRGGYISIKVYQQIGYVVM